MLSIVSFISRPQLKKFLIAYNYSFRLQKYFSVLSFRIKNIKNNELLKFLIFHWLLSTP